MTKRRDLFPDFSDDHLRLEPARVTAWNWLADRFVRNVWIKSNLYLTSQGCVTGVILTLLKIALVFALGFIMYMYITGE